MTVKNIHKVYKKQWKKWSTEARKLFNDVYEEIGAMGPDLFLHPKTLDTYKFSKDEFKTIAWNAAFIAACNCGK